MFYILAMSRCDRRTYKDWGWLLLFKAPVYYVPVENSLTLGEVVDGENQRDAGVGATNSHTYPPSHSHVNRTFSLIYGKKLFGETSLIKTTPSQWVPPYIRITKKTTFLWLGLYSVVRTE